jgi:hypothetical protein
LNGASKFIERVSGVDFDMSRILRVVVAAVMSKCEFAKWGLEIRENYDLQTHLKRKRDFTGNL